MRILSAFILSLLFPLLSFGAGLTISTTNGLAFGTLSNATGNFVVRSNGQFRAYDVNGSFGMGFWWDKAHGGGSDPQTHIDSSGSFSLNDSLAGSVNPAIRNHFGQTAKTESIWTFQYEGAATSGRTNVPSKQSSWTGAYWTGAASAAYDFGARFWPVDNTTTNWTLDWRLFDYLTLISVGGNTQEDVAHTNYQQFSQQGIGTIGGSAGRPNFYDLNNRTNGAYISAGGGWGVSQKGVDVFGGDITGTVGMGTARGTGHADTGSTTFDLALGNAYPMVLGAENGATTRGNNQPKLFRIGLAPYSTAANPNMAFNYYGDNIETDLDLGGGTSLYNAVTHFGVWTAAGVGTATGTQRLAIDAGRVKLSTATYEQSTNALSAWPTSAASGGGFALVNSNGTVFLLTSTPSSTAWAATNKLAP